MSIKINSRRSLRVKLRQFGLGVIAVLSVMVVGGVGYVLYLHDGDSPDIPDQKTHSLSGGDIAEGEIKPKDSPLKLVDQQIPVRLIIESIGVDAPIVPVGVEPDGAMAAPKTATDIGWYEKSALVGSSKRAMLLSGHYGLDAPEVLRRLNELKKGDKLVVEGARGDVLVYEVAETERKHRTEVDMEKAFRYGGGQEAVSIITCIGMYNYAEKTYNDRYVVYALRVK